MKRIFVFPVLLVAGFVALAQGGPARPWSAMAAYPGADLPYVASQQCLPDGTVSVTIGWTSYSTGSQWVDISAANNGFIPGTYSVAGPLPFDQNSITWGLQPSTTYFARIDTLTDYGLFSTQTLPLSTGTTCQAAPIEPPWDIPFTPPGASAS
jgi:hypothetical protein